MSWNYRVVRQDTVKGEFFAIHEVYYSESGKPYMVTERPSNPQGLTLRELRSDAKAYARALTKPVLDYVDIVGPEPWLEGQVCEAVVTSLSPELRRPKFQTAGHCYVATEAAYYLLGGKKSGWRAMFVKHEGAPHWYLRHTGGKILDLTADQFSTPVPYERGKGKGFLSPRISKRAEIVRKRALAKLPEAQLSAAKTKAKTK